MMWFILSFIAAFFDATYFVLVKRYLREVDFYLLAAGVSLFSFFLTISGSILNGIPVTGAYFYPYTFLIGLLEVVAMILYLKALESHDLSLSIPMLSFTPVFLVVTSFFILGESASLLGIAGILLVVFGSYILNFNKDEGNLLQPFKELFINRGTRYMLLVAFIWGVETNFIKILVLNSDPFFTAAAISFVMGAVFTGISYTKKEDIRVGFLKNSRRFIIAAFVVSISAVVVNYALIIQIVPYVLSIKRLSVLFAVLYGYILFKEKDVKRRMTGSVIMVMGSVLILLSTVQDFILF